MTEPEFEKELNDWAEEEAALVALRNMMDQKLPPLCGNSVPWPWRVDSEGEAPF